MGFLLSLINPLGGIAKAIAAAYAARQNATTDRDRIDADQQIKTLEARRDVLVAEARSPGNIIMRALLAVPVVAILWKLFIWDKCLGWGSTTMSADTWHVVWVVLGFYFVDNIIQRITRR